MKGLFAAGKFTTPVPADKDFKPSGKVICDFKEAFSHIAYGGITKDEGYLNDVFTSSLKIMQTAYKLTGDALPDL